MLITSLLAIALLSALPPLLSRPRYIWLVAFLSSTAILILGTYVGVLAIMRGPLTGANEFWYVDAMAGLLVVLVSFIQWTATMTSRVYLAAELDAGVITDSQYRRFFVLVPLFVFAMLLSTVSNNLGILWIALEATTLATTLLVAFYARKGSLEAAWKYLLLCSTGIALGLAGLMIAFFAGQLAGVHEGLSAINWTTLHGAAPFLSPMLLQLAFVFVLIGYGTKAGLVPMHTWLPDAHSSAPSPISGLLSGVLLPVALFAILRFKTLVDIALGDPTWTGNLLIVFGLLSIAVPAAFTLVQGDYKRLLAYSSIEHMGIVALGFGIGGLAAVAAVVHLVGHALAKSALFFGAGNMVTRFHSTKFDRVGDVAKTLPITAALFAAALLALLAVPPSPLFLSEFVLVSQAIAPHPYASAILLLSLTIVAAGFIRFMIPLLYAPAERAKEHAIEQGESWNLSHSMILLHLVIIFVLGVVVWLPAGSALVIRIASSIIT